MYLPQLFKGLINALLKDALCSINHLYFLLQLSFNRVTDQLLATTTFPEVQALRSDFKGQNSGSKGSFCLLLGLSNVLWVHDYTFFFFYITYIFLTIHFFTGKNCFLKL